MGRFGSIKPCIQNIGEIVDFPVPTDKDMLRSFLGVVGFYKKFVPDFAVTVQPLFNLLKKDVDFTWDIDCQKGFEYVKKELQNPKSLGQPNFSKSSVLYTDASNKAIGFVLIQKHDNVLKPLTWESGRVLTETECRYATIDKELFAIYFTVKRNEVYILNHTCIIYTDHKPLGSLKLFKDVVNKRYMWILYLETLGVSLGYVRGRENIFAEFVSRNVKDKDDNFQFNLLMMFLKVVICYCNNVTIKI